MVLIHLREDLHHVVQSLRGHVSIRQRHHGLGLRVDSGRQPHRRPPSAIDEMRRAMCETVAAERANEIGHHGQVCSRIGKSPADHRITGERQGDHADHQPLIGWSGRPHIDCRHGPLVDFYFPAAAADGGICGRGRRLISPSACTTGTGAGAPCAAIAGSMKRPKIILPAVVCSTLVTTTSMVRPIILRALSTTTIVPSSRYATPWLYSLPSFRMNTFMISPGSTTGFSALASSLMFSTSTPRSCATLFRLKSFVTIFPCSVRASSISLRSTSRISGKSMSEIDTSMPAIFWIF